MKVELSKDKSGLMGSYAKGLGNSSGKSAHAYAKSVTGGSNSVGRHASGCMGKGKSGY